MRFASSKAISPMIATVLLIAFTVAVGGILSLWMTGLTTTTTSSVENATTDQVKCSGTYINVMSVSSSAVVISNIGSQAIVNPICYWGNGTLIDSFGTTLSPGGSNSSSKGRATETSVICSGKCLTIGVTGECKLGQSCWK